MSNAKMLHQLFLDNIFSIMHWDNCYTFQAWHQGLGEQAFSSNRSYKAVRVCIFHSGNKSLIEELLVSGYSSFFCLAILSIVLHGGSV